MPETSAAVRHRAKNFYGRTPPSLPKCKTELDILIERHQFIRDSDEQNLSWEDALARKTYDQLFKELAVCDLSRWKEGKVAMRWRTASEVIDGKGHFTCSNLKCKYHEPSKLGQRRPVEALEPTKNKRSKTGFEEQESYIPLLDTSIDHEPTQFMKTSPSYSNSINVKIKVHLQELQTSFGYLEHGERKLAQVKLTLCKKCVKKMNSCSLSRRNPSQQVKESHLSRKRDLTHDCSHSTENHDSGPVKIRLTNPR